MLNYYSFLNVFYKSVKAFASRTSKLPRIDVVLENAGIAAPSFRRAEGHEITVTVNVVSTFLLALLLLPKLKSTAIEYQTHPRLTIVSSEVYSFTKLKERYEPDLFKALDNEAKADMPSRYPLSKLLEVLTVRHIAPKRAGLGIVLNYLNPGLCHSSLSRRGG